MKHIAPVSQAGAVGRMFGTTGKMQTDDPRKGGFEERGRGRRSRRSDSRISSGGSLSYVVWLAILSERVAERCSEKPEGG